MRQASCCYIFLCVVLAAAYLKYSLVLLVVQGICLALSFHCDTHTHTHTNTYKYTQTHIGVGVFRNACLCFTMELVGECLKCFASTDARRACCRGVIGSTMGAHPRGTGSNPVEGNGHFFPSCRQLYFSSFSDTQTHKPEQE